MDSSNKLQAPTQPGEKAYDYSVISLLMALGITAIVGIYILASHPKFGAPSKPGNEATTTTRAQDIRNDKAGVELITFSSANAHAHYFRDNNEAGKILIITGMVRNSYPEARRFIKMRGSLLDADGQILADRFIYAGNVLTEDELTTLPILEIQSCLNVRNGRSGYNKHILPGVEIPFMVVFDRIPASRAGYTIDPVSSELAN